MRYSLDRACAWLLVAAVVSWAPRAAGAESYSDYDRRVARTLFNTLKEGSAATVEKADPGALDTFKRSGGASIYMVNIAGKDGGTMHSGLYRISVNDQASEPQTWTSLGIDRETRASIFVRVPPTTAEKYKIYAVRRQIGNVILTAVLRRPFDEGEPEAKADMLRRYKLLLANAKENKLFAGVRMVLRAGEGVAQDMEVGAEPLRIALPAEGDLKLRYDVSVLDSESRPVGNVARLMIKPTGRLERFAKIDGERARYDPQSQVYIITDPQDTESFTLVIKSSDPKLRDELYQALTDSQEQAGPIIGAKVRANFK